jgi:rsbT co-antagonist protein RsbR
MTLTHANVLPQILARDRADLLKAWMAEHSTASGRKDLAGDEVLAEQAGEFLDALEQAIRQGNNDDPQSPTWVRVQEILADISRLETKRGLNPSEVATFVFSLKSPLFQALHKQTGKDSEIFAKEIWNATLILDRLGLYTTEVALKIREEVISRQQTEMLELSTPVVKLWEGILALPLIGTLDSERTQVVMENLLEEIVKSEAGIAIIDITGVPTVDTLVAQHLLKTVAAARLMGAECIISGIRPQIAATIVHLGVNLGDVVTKATLADAFSIALRRSDLAVVKTADRGEKG